MPAVRAAIALGSNLDDPEAHVKRAFADLASIPQTWVLARSSLHRTKPVGYADQPDFVNACALVETRLPARELLDQLLAIEKRHGRVREIPNGPRTLDLDIVLYGGATIDEPGLTVPHPRAHERAFVLEPLLEVWPEAEIPGKGKAKDFVIPARSAIVASARHPREGGDPAGGTSHLSPGSRVHGNDDRS